MLNELHHANDVVCHQGLGNIQTIITRRGSGNPQTVGLGVDRSTDRLSGSIYDVAGDLTSSGGFVYGYDAFEIVQGPVREGR